MRIVSTEVSDVVLHWNTKSWKNLKRNAEGEGGLTFYFKHVTHFYSIFEEKSPRTSGVPRIIVLWVSPAHKRPSL